MSKFLRRKDLASRWGVSQSTISKRPAHMLPPTFELPGTSIKIYRLEDVLDFETRHIRKNDNTETGEKTRNVPDKAGDGDNEPRRGRRPKPPIKPKPE